MSRTVIEKLYDFREVAVPEKLLELKVSAETIDGMLDSVAERFLTIEPVSDEIRPGDIAAVRIQDEARGSRSVHVNVGLGFAEKALEDALPGLRAGDRLPAETGIPGEIVSVKRRMIPQLTDGLISRLGLEGISTIAAYRDYALQQAAERIKRKKGQVLVDFVIKAVLERSVFRTPGPDDEDYRVLNQGMERQVDNLAEACGGDRDLALARVLNMEGQPAAACREALGQQCAKMAAQAAAGRMYANGDGIAYTREDAAARLREYAPQLGGAGEAPSEEQLDSFVLQMYIQYFQQSIFAYYSNQFHIMVS